MMTLRSLGLLLLMLLATTSLVSAAEDDLGPVRLESLDMAHIQLAQDLPTAPVASDKPLTIAGTRFDHGLRTVAPSRLIIDLAGGTRRFTAQVGFDDLSVSGRPQPQAVFRIIADGKLLWDSEYMQRGGAAKAVDVDLTGVKSLQLVAVNGGFRGGVVNWANATFEGVTRKPQAVEPPKVLQMGILTPAPPASPRINGPSIYGARPGAPFHYTIPTTGKRPMTFSAQGLPKGLSLDAERGWIAGRVEARGRFVVQLQASNAVGKDQREFTIVIGDTIQLTPAMGWTSWNAWGTVIDDQKIRDAADMLVKSDLINHGWTYVNVDDGWERSPGSKDPKFGPPTRDKDGRFLPNANFPDMKALGDYIHARGLKYGIYSSPGPTTCAGFEGSYKHEELDAQTWADWGIDYLKYDMCSYGNIIAAENRNATPPATRPSLPQLQHPYRLMRAALDKTGRDIVLAICQYGMGDVHKWGKEVGGNSWRTTSDLFDNWGNVSRIGFSYHTKSVGFSSPGGFNDPDMLVVGWMSWGKDNGKTYAPKLTANEQYSHVSLWCLLAAPLLASFDPAHLDAFTVNLLSNDEVLAVNQDPLAKQAVAVDAAGEVWVKDLSDGSKAIGLFNRDDFDARRISVRWSDLGLTGPQVVRDLWRQKDMGTFRDEFAEEVPAHGVLLIRVRPDEDPG